MKQTEALDILKTGDNVYLTGSAGSGKTFVLSRYIMYAKQQKLKVGITASTGVAATQLGGTTINAWSGVGIKSHLTFSDILDLRKRKYLQKRIEQTDILIIDEISMLPAHMLEAVDQACRALKFDERPFGGMQVVLCGDFFQLPPIENTYDVRNVNTGPQFAYKSPLWEELDLKVCYLDKPYRQVDLKFLTMLREIRENNVTRFTWDTLKERFINPLAEGMTPTKLYTHTANADKINEIELEKLPGPIHTFEMEEKGNEIITAVMKRNSLAPELLQLKLQALVMFVKNNHNEGYVNGTMGKVVGFSDKDGSPIVETFSGQQVTVKPAVWEMEEDNLQRSTITQIPLRLAWAITIHKSQGMTLDAAEIDLGKSFVTGMGYVALSRVRNLDGLRLKSINRTALTVNNEVIAMDKKFQEESEALTQELRSSVWSKKNNKRADFPATQLKIQRDI